MTKLTAEPVTDALDEALRKYFRAVDDIRDAGEARMGDPTLIARMYRDAGERMREAEAILRAWIAEADSPLGHGTPVPEEAELPSGDARIEAL